MRNCSICSTCGKNVDVVIPESDLGTSSGVGLSKRLHDEKLDFVEHVLGVLIESRFGYDHPYVRIGEPINISGHSQMFVGFTLLTWAEMEAHLRENHLRQPVVMLDGERRLIMESDVESDMSKCVLLVLRPPADAGGSPSTRGSPTFPGT